MRQRLTVRRLAANLIVLVASLAFSLAAVEFAGRLFGVWRPDRSFRYHPVRGYELRPGIGDVNTLGLRGPELDPAHPAGVTRMVMLGDSYTFGAGVGPEESLPGPPRAATERRRSCPLPGPQHGHTRL